MIRIHKARPRSHKIIVAEDYVDHYAKLIMFVMSNGDAVPPSVTEGLDSWLAELDKLIKESEV